MFLWVLDVSTAPPSHFGRVSWTAPWDGMLIPILKQGMKQNRLRKRVEDF